MKWILPLALALVVACDDDNGPAGPEIVVVAGTYAATFTATEATDCEGFVQTGSIEGTMEVTQAEDQVTLQVTELNPNLRSDPTGTLDLRTGAFAFSGPIEVGDETTTVTAEGTITGDFDSDGGMDLEFEFTALTCTVRGTIVGQRGV